MDGSDFRTVSAYSMPMDGVRAFTVAMRTAQEPGTVTNAVRARIAEIDAEFHGVRTMIDRVELSLVDRRTPMLLALGLATVALCPAAIGLYGVSRIR